MKKTTKPQRVSITLKPEIAEEIQSFIQARNSGAFDFYRHDDPTDVSSMVKMAVRRLLKDVRKAHNGLVHEGKSIEEAIESFWRNKIWWEQNSMGDETKFETPAEIISIREGMK